MDPQVEALRRQRRADRVPPLHEMSPQEARIADLADIPADAGTPEPVASVLDREIPAPAARFRSESTDRPERAFPRARVHFYGGGWTLGNLDTSDAIGRALTNGVGCVTGPSTARPLRPRHAATTVAQARSRWVPVRFER